MAKPRLMFYNDGRHPLIYQYEPPIAREEYESAVDELVGTPVEALMFCLGDGRTQLYNTQIGELWGHNRDVWTHPVFHRAHRNAASLIDRGADPLKIILNRAHEKGLLLYPTLLVQVPSGDPEVDVRGSDFRFNNKQFDIGAKGGIDPSLRTNQLADFMHEEVRDERFAIIKEVVEGYDIDGFELQLNYGRAYFHPTEMDIGRAVMTEWIQKVHDVVKSSNSNRELVVRVPASMEGAHSIGLDVRRWISLGIVDVVVGNTFESAETIDQMTDFTPLVEAAKGTEVRVHAGLHSLVRSDRMAHGTIEVLRAAASNYWAQGIDGIYIAYWHGMWPYGDDYFAKLRELPHPDIMAPKTKFYFVPTAAERIEPETLEPGVVMQLPSSMEVNEPTSVQLRISDDIEKWSAASRIDEIILRVRVTNSTERDIYSVKLNGIPLPDSLRRTINTHYGKTSQYGKLRGYFFVYHLNQQTWPVQGINEVEVTLEECDPQTDPERYVYDVELEVRYLMGKRFYRSIQDSDLGPFT